MKFEILRNEEVVARIPNITYIVKDSKGFRVLQKVQEAEQKNTIRQVAKILMKYDTYSQYTGRTQSDLVRRLDIPNDVLDALYKEAL